MIKKSCFNNLIFNEFSDENNENWFDLKDKKFLNNIDTFYYSVLLDGDFLPDSDDKKVKYWRSFWKNHLDTLRLFDEPDFKSIPGLPFVYQLKPFKYGSGTYDFCLCKPDCWDIFFANKVSNNMTSQIIVQLRSKALWMDGVRKSIDESLSDIHTIIKYFGFKVIDIKENRIDYCWHTNYIQAPDVFFRPDKFAAMRVSRMDDSIMHIKYRGNDDYMIDYVTLGKKASNNVFFRIYLKSKEVVEKGYKAFFFKYWYLNGLINRYDLYCYEFAYENKNWDYVNLGRLKFYLEYGSDEDIKLQCQAILSEEIKLKYDDLKHFADMITPPVTLVVNVEYQTMRKFSASLFFDNSLYNAKKYGPASRLYDILDNYRAISNYLTTKCVRLVEPYGDKNKSRRPDIPFWDALSRYRAIDNKLTAKDTILLRQYDHKRNADLVKKRALGSISSFNLYHKGMAATSSEQDIVDFINSLNDNDFESMAMLQKKKLKRADYREPLDMSELIDNGRFLIIDRNSGEIMEGFKND